MFKAPFGQLAAFDVLLHFMLSRFESVLLIGILTTDMHIIQAVSTHRILHLSALHTARCFEYHERFESESVVGAGVYTDGSAKYPGASFAVASCSVVQVGPMASIVRSRAPRLRTGAGPRWHPRWLPLVPHR